MGWFVTLSITMLFYYAECRNLFIGILNVIMLSVVVQQVRYAESFVNVNTA